MQLRVQKLTETAIVPTRAYSGDVGNDLYSDEEIVIPPWSRKLVRTGIAVAIPEGCYGRVAPRSGLSCNNIDVGAGVIDRGYRGEVKICLINSSDQEFRVSKGMKIAQLVCEKVEYPQIVCVDMLDDTDRSDGGFGSSGYTFM